MHRFFVDSSLKNDNHVVITGDDVTHISKVLRLRHNDEITVCDPDGIDCLCRIEMVEKDSVTAQIVSRVPSLTEPPVKITLFQGVPKGDKLDTVVQKCVELGAMRVVPVAMKRSVAIIKDKEKKQQRLQKIALEAAKQCNRAIVPQIDAVMTFDEAIGCSSDFDLKLLPYEAEKSTGMKEALKGSADAKNICIFIGPEGGFDESEVEKARSSGFETVSMGPRIMRTETAPLAAITAVMYELGDW